MTMAPATQGAITLRIDRGDAPADLAVRVADPSVTVNEVLHAVGCQPTDSLVDGAPIDEVTGAAPAIETLHAGTVITRPSRREQPAHLPSELATAGRASGGAEPVIELSVVAGPDAGPMAALPRGRYRFGPDDHPTGWYLAIDHPDLAATHGAAWFDAAETVETVDGPGFTLALSTPIDPQPQHAGFLHRPPRRLAAATVPTIELEAAPKALNPPAPLSWATLLAPIPIALVMAFFFRPLFAIFAVMGPIVAFGRWFEGRRRHRRDTRARTIEVQRIRCELQRSIAATCEAEARRRWQCHPPVSELWKRARHRSVRLWERRPGAPDHLAFTVGVAEASFEPPIGDATPDPEVHRSVTESHTLRPVPHTIDLSANLGVGFHGHRSAAIAAARSAVLQLVTLHGPADLRVGIVADRDRMADWDWLKWLPHLDPALVATDVGVVVDAFAPRSGHAPTARLAFRPDEQIADVRLVIVDAPTADVAAIHRAANDGEITVRFVAVAPAPTVLPAVCTALVGLDAGNAEITTPHLAAHATTVRATGVTAATAVDWAGSLSPMRDPELVDFATIGDDQAPSLLRLIDFVDDEQLDHRWQARRADEAPIAAIGEGPRGAVSIDLTADGPHALVAGTTGSGKSEFLRSFVLSLAAACPPDHLNFVLVDFKGGGAFDVCADLPHVAGLITDLDEALVSRAINSLRAELHRRETLFRSLGVSSYDDAANASTEPIARLVIVIDEFAALATDYGELLTAIIDLAARGRSLGMHLVLATQRPSGVVDQKIRANTNLRIALRVQDAHDSHDVIGTPAAAAIDRKSPGRAIVSIGGDTPFTVQTAYSGAADRRHERCAVTEFRLCEPAPAAGQPEVAAAAAAAPAAEARTELDVLTASIARVAAARGLEARPLWADPLPETLDWIDLGARRLSPDAAGPGLALGLADLPERQTQLPWRWNPDDGSLALYGASAATSGRLLCSIGAAIASTAAVDDAHLYVIDGDAGNASALASFAHTGAYVAAVETDRVERTLSLIERALAERRREPSPAAPRLFLLIDNLASVTAGLDDVARLAFVERLSSLARDGAPQRVHLVVTARTPRDLSHRLAQQIAVRLVADLADPSGFLTLGLRSSQVVDLPAMRAIDLADQRVVQLVEPPARDSIVVPAPNDPSRAPQPVRTLPTMLDIDQLGQLTVEQGTVRMPIGLDAEHVEPVTFELRPGANLMIVGPHESGRTSMLAMLAGQLDMVDGIDRVMLGGDPTTLGLDTKAALDPATAVETMKNTDRRTVVFVDDAAQLDSGHTAALTGLIALGRDDVHVVVATTADHARGLRASVAPLRTSATGLLLGGLATDGDIFKVKRPPIDGLGTVVGRGHLVVRGRPIPLQAAHAPRRRVATPGVEPASAAPRQSAHL